MIYYLLKEIFDYCVVDAGVVDLVTTAVWPLPPDSSVEQQLFNKEVNINFLLVGVSHSQ